MRTSSIYLKFASEATYERLTFTSNVVTYPDIKKHLEKKKYVCKWNTHILMIFRVPREKNRKERQYCPVRRDEKLGDR